MPTYRDRLQSAPSGKFLPVWTWQLNMLSKPANLISISHLSGSFLVLATSLKELSVPAHQLAIVTKTARVDYL
jgi:hypothetical protein